MRRADRLLKITHFLRGRRRAVTAQQIAEAFEISTRTVYRDIQALMDSGAPITGEAGVGYIIDKTYYLPPVTFDADELEALGLGISVVSHWTDPCFAEKAESALAKIRAVLPAVNQGDLADLTTYARKGRSYIPWTVSFPNCGTTYARTRKINMTYIDQNGTISHRTVRPLALVFFSPAWLLAGWCEMRGEFRHFRIDRMQTLTDAGGFAQESGKTLADYRATEAQC